MAKRMVSTDIWNDPWFRKLPGRVKLTWKYLSETSDSCGVVKRDTDLWGFTLSILDMDWDAFFKKVADRIVVLPNGDIWLPHVVRDQYGPLSENCRAHRGVLDFLRKHKLLEHPEVLLATPIVERATQVADTLSKPIAKGIQRVSKKEPATKFVPPSLDEVRHYCLERKNGLNAESIFDHYQANGWVQGKSRKPIKCWRAAIRTCEHREMQDKKEQAPVKQPLISQVKESLDALAKSEANRQPMLAGR